MKSAIKLLIIATICFCLTGCIKFQTKQPDYPTEFENSRWVAQEVDFYFDVDDRIYDESPFGNKGIIETKGKSEIITLVVAHGGYMSVWDLSALEYIYYEDGSKGVSTPDETFYGRVSNESEQSFILKVDEEYQYIFGDEPIKEITFVREEMPKDEESESLDISKGE